MKLTRARPRPEVAFRMPIEEGDVGEAEVLANVYNIGTFTEAVILGQSTIGYSKVLLVDYLQELVLRNRTSEVIEQLDGRLKHGIQILVKDVDTLDEVESQGVVVDVDDRNHQLFSKLERCWCHLRSVLGELIQIFAEVEIASEDTYSTWRTGMRYFREQLDQKEKLHDRLMTAMLDRITDYRDGKDVIFCQMRNIVEMFSFIGNYNTFEERMLAETRTYYRQVVSQVLSQNSVFQSCRIFQNKIRHEEECCRMYLLKPSIQRVMETLRIQVLQLNSDVLMHETELKYMLTSGDMESMEIILALYAQTEWKGRLHDAIFAAMQSIGDDITRDFTKEEEAAALALQQADYDSFIMRLYRFKDVVDFAIKKALPYVPDYKNKEQMLWNKMLNQTQEVSDIVTTALASYADNEPHMLQTGESIVEDNGVSFIMHLFRSLENKPYFEESFRRLLSRRLLYSQEINEAHINIVSILKEECGASYVAKLDALIVDYQSSSTYNVEYKDSKEEGGDSCADEIPFSALIISTDTWLPKAHVLRPVTDDAFSDCDVDSTGVDDGVIDVQPDQQTVTIKDMQNRFGEFYATRYKNRSLNYLPDFGYAVLQMEFKGEIYDLKLSVCQAYCLLAFNSMETLSLACLGEIMEKEYNEILLRKHLSVLNSAPSPLILFKTAGLSFESCGINDHFVFNMDCEPPAKIWDLQFKDPLFDNSNSVRHKGITVEDITPSIEAAIVRHLKSKLEDSATAVFKICHEKFSTIDRFAFNKIIDSLVDRDFVAFERRRELLKYVP